MLMDIIILIVGVLIITYSAIEGFARSLMHLIIFYVITLILGMVLLSINITQDLARRITTMTGGMMPDQSLFIAWLFLALLIPTTIGIFLLTHFTMENVTFSRIQWLDTLLAIVSGLVFALVFMSLLTNSWGIIASIVWTPENMWMTMRKAYATSLLRPFMQRILTIYRSLLFPFRLTRYPIVYNVQL